MGVSDEVMKDFIEDAFSALDEFYPGSKRKRKEKAAPKEVAEIKSWDARPYFKTMPNGQDMELFTLGALADALGRPIITVRHWIKVGHLPTSPYRLPTKPNKNGDPHQGRRLYSRAQIEAAIKIFDEAGLLHEGRVEWSYHQQVTKDIAEAWDKLRVEETTN